MKVIFIYDEKLIEAFIRTSKACNERGLNKIPTLFLLRELLKEGECKLYEFFQDKGIVAPEEILEVCIDEYVDDGIRNQLARKNSEKIEPAETSEETANNEENYEPCFTLPIKYDGKTYVFILDEELGNVICNLQESIILRANQIEKENPEELKDGSVEVTVGVEAISLHLIKCMPKEMTRFLRDLGLKVSEVQGTLTKAKEPEKEETNGIPEKMKTFLKDVTAEYEVGTENLILGRDKETNKIWEIISKMNKRNAMLIGEPGVGKTAIIQKMAQDIKNGVSPEKFKDYRIISLDINGIIAGTTLRGQAETRFNELNTFLENTKNVILFVDEIHTMLGAGACREGEMDLANSMKPILAKGNTIVIGATTTTEYDKYFSKDGALKRRFEKVEIKEPKTREIYPMLKNKIRALEEYHGVRVRKGIIDFIIFTASCFNYETKNPDRTLDLIDRSMVVAKNAGKAMVDKQSVLKNYDLNYDRFKNMSLEEKKSTAYHEAGHFVAHTMSGRLKAYSTIAVSIMPAESYLGINVYEETDNVVSPNMEYYTDELAANLAGREAERLILGADNSGVSDDLKKATKTAYKVITEYGMVDGYNMVYLHNDGISMLTEKSMDMINKSVQELLKKAEERAKELLTENRTLLDMVAKELLEKKMLSSQDLNRIIKSVSAEENAIM